MPQVKALSVRHDQIMDWLIANPVAPLAACAAEFGITQGWLSCIIHSDLFQAKLKERQEEVFGEVAITVKDRITALAHESLERLTLKVQVENDVDKLVSASEVALKALGFGAPKVAQGTGATTVNVTVIDKNILAEARRRMGGAVIDGEAPAEIPASITDATGISE